MKPVGIFGNNISKCPDIMRKRTPISPHRVQSNKVKDYVSSVGSPCNGTKPNLIVSFGWGGETNSKLQTYPIFPSKNTMDGSPYRQIRKKNYNTVAEGGHPVASGLSVLMSQCPGVPFFQCPGVPESRIRSVPDLHNSLHRLPLRYIPCFAASSGEEEPSIEDTGSRNNDQDEHEEGDSDEEYVTGGAVAEEEKLSA